ncbi:hypothetical protein ABZ354_25115 [Streptomyces sp. NPDC005925]|uniref:hypothetical protein n=1 Tax=Streptomyces sp. NPDC005925 TaxID=3157172 RepID=UPI0033C5AF6F
MLTIAVPCIVECVDHIKVHQQAIAVYRGASLCPAGTRWQAADDCVARTPAEITGAGTRQSCTTDSNGVSSCTTYYSVTVRFGQRRQKMDVEEGTYRTVRRGDTAELRIWRGEIVRMVVRGHTETYLTSSEWASVGWLLLGWLLLGASWVALLGLRLFPLLGGWLVLTVPYLMVAYHLMGFNPMGVTGWGVAGAFTVAGLWTTGYLFSEVVDGRP